MREWLGGVLEFIWKVGGLGYGAVLLIAVIGFFLQSLGIIGPSRLVVDALNDAFVAVLAFLGVGLFLEAILDCFDWVQAKWRRLEGDESKESDESKEGDQSIERLVKRLEKYLGPVMWGAWGVVLILVLICLPWQILTGDKVFPDRLGLLLSSITLGSAVVLYGMIPLVYFVGRVIRDIVKKWRMWRGRRKRQGGGKGDQ